MNSIICVHVNYVSVKMGTVIWGAWESKLK